MSRKFSGDKLVIATHNQGKLEEIQALLAPYGVEVVGAATLGLDEPEETETTFVGNARIKWPNDILVDGAKIAGILLERAGDAVIAGIGVNVTGHPEDLDRPVTSLKAQGAIEADAGALLERLAALFSHWLAVWRAQGWEPVRAHWLLNAHPRGTAMRVLQPDGEQVEGAFDTLDQQGMLILRLADGQRRAIHAGDIILN